MLKYIALISGSFIGLAVGALISSRVLRVRRTGGSFRELYSDNYISREGGVDLCR